MWANPIWTHLLRQWWGQIGFSSLQLPSQTHQPIRPHKFQNSFWECFMVSIYGIIYKSATLKRATRADNRRRIWCGHISLEIYVRTIPALCPHNISRGIYVFFVRCCADIVRTLCPSSVFTSGIALGWTCYKGFHNSSWPTTTGPLNKDKSEAGSPAGGSTLDPLISS